MNTDTEAVTVQQPFYTYDGDPVFSVNAGIPADDAQEIATNLMYYVERLAAADAFTDKTIEAGIIQHLSEMAKALNMESRAGRRASGD